MIRARTILQFGQFVNIHIVVIILIRSRAFNVHTISVDWNNLVRRQRIVCMRHAQAIQAIAQLKGCFALEVFICLELAM
jgi:hypothetical protein